PIFEKEGAIHPRFAKSLGGDPPVLVFEKDEGWLEFVLFDPNGVVVQEERLYLGCSAPRRPVATWHAGSLYVLYACHDLGGTQYGAPTLSGGRGVRRGRRSARQHSAGPAAGRLRHRGRAHLLLPVRRARVCRLRPILHRRIVSLSLRRWQMVRRIFSRAASALFVLLVLPGKAHALVPGSVPAPGTMRVFGEGIQVNPVVTASGGIAYSNWHGEPWLKLEGRHQGVFWRDDYRASEKDAYSLVPGDSANCVQLTGSVDSLACLFDQFDSMAYGSKVWFKPTVTQTLMSTAFQWGRHAKPSIWDDGAPNHRVRLAVSKFEGGNWYIHLMGKQGISSQYWQIVTGGNQEEPAMGRDFVAWEDHRPWEPGLNNRYITFAHEANGYGTSHTIGRGRHPSAGALG